MSLLLYIKMNNMNKEEIKEEIKKLVIQQHYPNAPQNFSEKTFNYSLEWDNDMLKIFMINSDVIKLIKNSLYLIRPYILDFNSIFDYIENIKNENLALRNQLKSLEALVLE